MTNKKANSLLAFINLWYRKLTIENRLFHWPAASPRGEQAGRKLLAKAIFLIYEKIFKINDSPQKIALGLGVGVFLGVLPGTGPIAAVIFASILRINKASALLGSLLVNTWINIVTFVFAIQIGSVIIGANWQQIYNESLVIFSNFKYSSLLKLPILKLILPILIGYLIIAFFIGFFAYISAYLILSYNKNRLH